MNDSQKESDGDAVNIPQLLAAIRERTSLIYKITGFCLILGIIYALITPVEYMSEAMVMPEMGGDKGQLSGLLEDYGGILGLGDSEGLKLSEDNTIAPEVYPQIVRSLTFQLQMIDDTVYFADADTSLTIYAFLKDRVGRFYDEWIGDPYYRQGLSALPPALRQQFNNQEISSVTPKELQVIKEMRERIEIELESGTGVIEITAQMPDAVASAQVCNKAINLLTDYLKEYRTQKAQNVLAFANEQYEIGQSRFREAQNKLAEYEDQNVNINTAKAEAQLEYLEAEFDLAYSVYNSVAQKRIQARMNLQENTPVFKTLQTANVPLERDEPQWVPIIIFSLAVGIVLSFVIIAGGVVYHNLNAETQHHHA